VYCRPLGSVLTDDLAHISAGTALDFMDEVFSPTKPPSPRFWVSPVCLVAPLYWLETQLLTRRLKLSPRG